MGVSLSVTGYASKDSEEFNRHYGAVLYCVKNKLSFPKETEEFFNGRICGGGDLDDFATDYLLEKLEHGLEVDIPTDGDAFYDGGLVINVADIPEECDQIVIDIS